MVLIAKEDKRKVFEYLLQEGVIVFKKDMNLPKHEETGVPNLHVWMLLRSLKDKGLVEEHFNWQYYYYCIKADGVKFLRDKIGITDDTIEPITFQQTKRIQVNKGDEEDGADRPRRFGGQAGKKYGRGGRGGFYPGDRKPAGIGRGAKVAQEKEENEEQ